MRQAEGRRTDAPPSSPFFPHTKSQRLRGKLQGKFWGGYTLNNPRTLPNPTSGTATESFQLNSVRNPSVTLAWTAQGSWHHPRHHMQLRRPVNNPWGRVSAPMQPRSQRLSLPLLYNQAAPLVLVSKTMKSPCPMH